MTGSSFKIVLREGITGGFVGPSVKQVIQIAGDGSRGAMVEHAQLQPGSKADYVTRSSAVSTEQVADLVKTVREQLADLPTEDPVGSEDIYGLDTSIMFYTDDFRWANGGPEGCAQGEQSSVQATEEQKQVFARVVDMIASFSAVSICNE